MVYVLACTDLCVVKGLIRVVCLFAGYHVGLTACLACFFVAGGLVISVGSVFSSLLMYDLRFVLLIVMSGVDLNGIVMVLFFWYSIGLWKVSFSCLFGVIMGLGAHVSWACCTLSSSVLGV